MDKVLPVLDFAWDAELPSSFLFSLFSPAGLSVAAEVYDLAEKALFAGKLRNTVVVSIVL
jgi:hypothetical protein